MQFKLYERARADFFDIVTLRPYCIAESFHRDTTLLSAKKAKAGDAESKRHLPARIRQLPFADYGQIARTATKSGS
jgi:hypothetical protein